MNLLQVFTILFPGSLLYLLKCYPKSPQQKDVLKNWNFWAMGFVSICGLEGDEYLMHTLLQGRTFSARKLKKEWPN
jgi:hypothetical protein